MLLFQHREIHFVDPPGKVVYEEEPAQSAALLASGEYARIPYLGTFAGTDWNPVARIAPFDGPMIFLHRLVDPVGRQRLVAVQYNNVNEEELGNGRVGRLAWILIQPATLMPGSQQKLLGGSKYDLALGLNAGDRVRFFGGQPDPSDPSRFTIRYEINDVPGLIEGKLTANDRIDLKQR